MLFFETVKQNGSLTPLQENALGEPEKYSAQVFDNYISLIAEADPEISQELLRLAEFKTKNIKSVEALEDWLYAVRNPENKTKLEFIKNDGMKAVRKQNSWLEAGTWIALDREFYRHNLIIFAGSEYAFLEDAWKSTSESNNFKSVRWENFDEVVNRLYSPILVSTYMKNQLKYIPEPPFSTFQTAIQTFNLKGGDCEDHGMFAAWSLGKNGYESYVVGAGTRNTINLGHAVGMYKDKDGKFYAINTWNERAIANTGGPYNTIEELVERETYRDWNHYRIWDLNWNVKSDKIR